MERLTGKTAFITAAGQGIGRATAELFAAEGARVIATDINEASLAELMTMPGVETRRLDVLDAAAVAEATRQAGEVHILFNCAGVVHNGAILESEEADLDFALNLNVKSMMRTIKAFLPGMLERGEGSIVNMASIASSVKGFPNRCIYGVTKAAVIGLTKSVAADYVSRGIRCNAVCPGTVDTPSLQERLHAQGDYEKAHAAFVARQPMGRLGRPREIAEAVLYLATATFVTGQAHTVDGGITT